METAYSMQDITTSFMYRVYGWMSLGLALTAAAADYVSLTPFANRIATSPGLLIGLFIAQLGLVVLLSFFSNHLTYVTAALAFIAYSLLTGVTLSVLFLTYTQASLASTFFITAAMFAVMALWGYFTKADLTSLGSIFSMALIGLIIGFVINMFLKSSAFYMLLSAAGVIIFAVLTAFDVQRIKLMSYELLNTGHLGKRVSILGALTLYLDFINLFLSLLTFTGKRKD